jgi:hypothetical protein
MIKQANKTSVQYVPNEHVTIFKCVAKVYKREKVHNIGGLVLFILVEDETKVRSKIAWGSRSDHLINFCGAKFDHHCVTNFNLVVGIGKDEYNKILKFTNYTIASFARVIIVNPLHDKLLKLILWYVAHVIVLMPTKFNTDVML